MCATSQSTATAAANEATIAPVNTTMPRVMDFSMPIPSRCRLRKKLATKKTIVEITMDHINGVERIPTFAYASPCAAAGRAGGAASPPAPSPGCRRHGLPDLELERTADRHAEAHPVLQLLGEQQLAALQLRARHDQAVHQEIR